MTHMATISKSKYTLFRKCGKCLWLTVKRPDLQEIDEQTQERFKNGTAVGDLAKKRFGEWTDVTTLIPLKDSKGNVILDASPHFRAALPIAFTIMSRACSGSVTSAPRLPRHCAKNAKKKALRL